MRLLAMLQTLRGWMSNAGDRLDLMWTEPLSWIVMLVTVAAVVRRRSRFHTWREPVAMAGIGLWVVALLAMTVYPLGLEAPSADRFEIRSVIPFAGTSPIRSVWRRPTSGIGRAATC